MGKNTKGKNRQVGSPNQAQPVEALSHWPDIAFHNGYIIKNSIFCSQNKRPQDLTYEYFRKK